MRIGKAALISPTQASSYYGSTAVSTDELAAVTGTATPTPPEIIEMSRALKNNVDLIYAYVRNNIQVSWMYGLQKGALGALIDRAGTPFDQVDLFVKLLRQANINSNANYFTANYQIGTVTLTGAQFTAWTGISDSNAACQMLANGGIPAIVNGSTTMVCGTGTGSTISSVAMAHIWAQVAISSSCHACGQTGTFLFDPSYKPLAKVSGINLASAASMTTGDPLNSATGPSSGMGSGTISTVGYVQNLNSSALNTLIQGYAQNLLTYLYNNNLSAAQLEDLVGGGVIAPDSPPSGGWRQTSLPYSTAVAATWTGNVPDQYRTKLSVTGYMWDYVANKWDNMFPQITSSFFVDQVYGRTFTLDTDYGPGMGIGSHSKYANTVYLALDGVPLASYYNPAVDDGHNAYGYEIYQTSRGAPASVSLTANHPYASSADGTATARGDYMDTTISRPVSLITSLTIVDGFGDAGPELFTKWSDERAGDTGNHGKPMLAQSAGIKVCAATDSRVERETSNGKKWRPIGWHRIRVPLICMPPSPARLCNFTMPWALRMPIIT